MTDTPRTWGSSGTAGHETHGQYAVYHEGTGKDIAIVYDGKAHAHLIAAAPDLLRALEQIAVSSTEFADLCVPMSPECAGIISKWAKAAIAKAKGQE